MPPGLIVVQPQRLSPHFVSCFLGGVVLMVGEASRKIHMFRGRGGPSSKSRSASSRCVAATDLCPNPGLENPCHMFVVFPSHLIARQCTSVHTEAAYVSDQVDTDPARPSSDTYSTFCRGKFDDTRRHIDSKSFVASLTDVETHVTLFDAIGNPQKG